MDVCPRWLPTRARNAGMSSTRTKTLSGKSMGMMSPFFQLEYLPQAQIGLHQAYC